MNIIKTDFTKEINIDSTSKVIFVVETYYHVLYSLILIKILSIKDNSIIIFKYLPDNMYELAKTLSKNNYTIEQWGKPLSSNFIGLVKYYFSLKNDYKFLKHLKEKYPKSKLVFINFFWGLTNSRYNVKPYMNICDIVYCFEHATYIMYVNNTNIFIKFIKLFLGLDFNFYKKAKVKKIIMSNPSVCPTTWFSKLYKISIIDLWQCLDNNSQKEILNYFIPQSFYEKIDDFSNIGIIYSQPFSEDGFITEQEKIDIYSQICHYYSQYRKIIFKPHPRDLTKYEFTSPNITIIDKNWPSELFILNNIHFKFAIGVCSSAVDSSDAEIKINLNKDFMMNKKMVLIPLNI